MKTILLTMAVLSSSTLFANSSTELFTVHQRKEVLRAIDNICADSWCEGDYNFNFKDLNCNKLTKSCELNFNFISTDDNNVEKYSALQTCQFKNITKFDQLMDSKFSLNDEFYDLVNNCISEKEDNIQF